jgi:1-acyl-sn-glycerol-3-phosphate acyltransferase
VVAVNHLSMLDVALVLTILPRRGICIATDSLRKQPWLRWFLDLGDTIYVRRGEADQEALARGLAVLRAGGLLGIAPEGTRSKTGGLMKGQPGVVFMAGEAPAPILPLAAWGQERVADNLKRLRRTRIRVRVGAPIAVSPGERTAARLHHDTERVMRALADLLPPEYRGVYADAVDRPEPSMADVAAR